MPRKYEEQINEPSDHPRRGNGVIPADDKSGPVNLNVYVKASTLDKMTFSRTWLVENLIESGRAYEIFGTWKGGKTLVVMDMAANMCMGRPWADRRTVETLVIYVAGEAVEDVEMRLAAWRKLHDVHDEIPFYIRTRPVDMTDEVFASLLAAEVEALNAQHPGLPVVVVWDTLNRNLGSGNENAEGMQAFTNNMIDIVIRPCKCAGIVVHHSGHGDKDRGRGHSSFEAAVDGLIKISKEKATNGPAVVTVEAMEMRSTAGDDSLSFRIEVQELPGEDNFGNPIEAPVLRYLKDYTPPQPEKSKKGLGENQKKALGILRELHNRHRQHLARSNNDPDRALVLIEDWKGECFSKGVSKDRRRFHEVKSALAGRGLVEIVGEIYARIPKSCEGWA